jgi:hypothetical protein
MMVHSKLHPCFHLFYPKQIVSLKDVHIVELSTVTTISNKTKKDIEIEIERHKENVSVLPFETYQIKSLPLETIQKIQENVCEMKTKKTFISTKKNPQKYVVAELKMLCEKHQLSTSGAKQVLIKRLQEHNIL